MTPESGHLPASADEDHGYLTTTGRRSGRPHTVEIWFAPLDGRVYLLAGGGDRADWVRNLRTDGGVRWRVGDDEVTAAARVVDGAESSQPVARRLLAARYQGWSEGEPLSAWATESLLVEVGPARPPREGAGEAGSRG